MPITRYQIRNVYSLADPELYKAADKDDPEALLEGVAMAGLVGLLRQLGDLAEFAAEIFHDLNEEVMATAARGHGLLVRVQQLESEFPPIERALLSQTCNSKFFPNSGIDWNPNRQTAQNLITTGDLPRFVMDSYEQCRAPPPLFLLDKFDVDGVGACLKRYTDPSFYKVETPSLEIESAEAQRDKKIHKTKKKGSGWKGTETQEVSHPSHSKLHQLFLEERMQNGVTEPARRVKLKKRPNKIPFDLGSGESYMNKLLNSPEDKLVHEVPVRSPILRLPSNAFNGSRLEILEDNMWGSASGSTMQSSSSCISSSVENTACGDPTDNFSRKVSERQTSELPTSGLSLGAGIVSSALQEEEEKHIAGDEEIRTDGLQNDHLSDDVASEADHYMDALATMESELETDAELRTKSAPSINQGTYSDANTGQFQSQLSDSQLIRNSTAPDDRNNSVWKGITIPLYYAPTSTSTENTSPVGDDSGPQPFACIEIPFHPRVPHKKVSVAERITVDHNIINDACIDVSKVPNVSSAIDSALPVDQVAISEDGTSKEADSYEVSSNHNGSLDSPRKNEDHQIDPEVTVACSSRHQEFLPTPDSLSSLSFVKNSEGNIDNRHPNNSSSPMIHLPNSSDTTRRISENSLSKVNQVGYAKDNHSSVTPRSDEQPFAPSWAQSDIGALDAKPSDTVFGHDVPLAEVAADNPDMYPSPEEQLKETEDGVLHISESAEALLPYSSEDETESNDLKNELMTGAVSDANRSRGNDRFVLKDEAELEEREIESVISEVKVGSGPLSVPDDLDRNGGTDLSSLEDDTEFQGRENSEVEESASVLLPVEVDKNEDNGHPPLEEPNESGSVMSQICDVQDSQVAGEKKKVDQHLVISPDSDDHPCDTAPYDSSSKPLLDSIPDTSLSTCDDVDNPSLNLEILQDRSHSFLAETDVLGDFGSQPGDTAPCDISNVQLLDSSSTAFTEANHLEPESLNHGNHDIFEAAKSSPLEDNVDQPNHQLHVQLPVASQMLSSLTHIDHGKDFDTHSEPYPVNLASPSGVHEEDVPTTIGVATTHLQDLHSPELNSVPVAEKPPRLELLQVSSHDDVKHHAPPFFSGFGTLPQLTPVISEDMPPFPPLPPMEWRLRKLRNAVLTPTDGGEHGDGPNLPSKADEGLQPTLDEIRIADQKAECAYEYPMRSWSQMLLPEAEVSLHTEDHEKPSEAKFTENLTPEAPVYHSILTTSGQEVFGASSNPQSLDEEMGNSMRIQQPRSPLIDAVAAHDKSKLRKVSDGSTPQTPKEEENDNLLEQIRAKSFNLKPAVQSRPSIQGPKTNLRMVAIIEKANAIRQAFAGSDDEDDDSDSWSD